MAVNAFPDVTPPTGEGVVVALSNGVVVSAYWDGAQWWSGINDNPVDFPLANEFVTSWEPAS